MSDDCLLDVSTLDALPPVRVDAPWLTLAEQARLQGIQAPLRQRQYLAGHWRVRELAARAFGGEPEQWQWDDQGGPRPQLLRDGRRAWATLSHCGEHLAAAVAAQPIGLDLELPRRPRDVMALARHMFSTDEVARLAAIDDDAERNRFFYVLWALKEARGKRGGEGLQATQARRVSARPSLQEDAEARVWRIEGGGAVALAGWSGLRVQSAGVQGAPTPWHYVAVD